MEFDPGDQFAEVLCGNAVLADDQLRIAGQECDGYEILPQIVGQRVHCTIDYVRGPVADVQRVAVGCSVNHPTDADVSGGTRHVFDDHRLTEACAHVR
jgi:hypothetical protein